jgi:ankyrin repeat protein
METLIENILKACAEGDVNLLAACLQYGLDLNFATESDGLTPLMYAITYAGTKLQGDYYNVVNMLLEGGADTNSVDATYNRTAAHWAAYCKQSDILFLLMSAGSDIAAVDIEGLTPFHISVTNNLYECVEVMIQSIPELVNYPTANGITPLMLACIEGHAKLCYLFLENGCEPNAIEPGTGQSSLHIAAEGGHAGIVGALLRYQVALDANDIRGLTPIHLACSNPTSDVLNIMCNAVGTTILELTDENGLTPLMHACINGSDSCVEFVVKKKANILYKESTENKTCLHWAVENSVCSPNIVRLLCRKKKQLINEVDVYGRTPLIAAAMSGHIEALKVLLEYSSDFYQTDNNQYSAIHWAVVCGQPTVLQELISCGCPINLIEKNGATSLHLAAQAAAASSENEMLSVGALQCIEVLLNAGASLNVFDNEGRQPLHWALQCSENLEAVELLIKNGADPTSASYDGLTGLHMAAKYGITDNCQYLIEVAGVDGNITDQHSQTALFYAVESQTIDCYAYLLSIGLSASHKNKDGRSPVHIAATLGSIEALELLTTYNGDINAVNAMNVTPIHDAATNGQIGVLSFLLRAGGNPNSPTTKVPSPLHYAVAEGYKDCAVLLLNAGADVNSYIVSEETGGPLTPLDYANDYPEIIEILQAKNGLYGKDITLPEVEEESTETVAEVKAAPIEDVIEKQDDEMKEKSSDTDSVQLRPSFQRS